MQQNPAARHPDQLRHPKMQAAGTDSAKLGKLLSQRERKVKRKQLALDKGNAIMRLGEAPVIYDSARTQRSVEQMTTYLRSHGFFRARVAATDTARYERGPVALRCSKPWARAISQGQPDSLDARQALPPRDGDLHHAAKTSLSSTACSRRSSPIRAWPPWCGAGGALRCCTKTRATTKTPIGQERTRLETLLLKTPATSISAPNTSPYEADTSYEQYHGAPAHRSLPTRPPARATACTRIQAGALRDRCRRGPHPAQRHRRYPAPRRHPRGPARPPQPGPAHRHHRNRFHPLCRLRAAATAPACWPAKVLVRPGQRYSLDRTLQTQRQLADLDMFRFNTVNYRKLPDPPRGRQHGPKAPQHGRAGGRHQRLAGA